MKKLNLLFSVLLCLSASTAKAEITPNPVFSEPQYGYGIDIAMSVGNDGQAAFQPAVVHGSGDDIEVIVYGPKFAVETRFTLENVLKTEPEYDNCYSDGLYLSTADLEEIMVTRNFFVKNDKWCILVVKSGTGGKIKVTVIDEDGNELGDVSSLYNKNNRYLQVVLDGFYKGTPYVLYEPEYKHFQLCTFTGTNSIQAVKAASFNAAYPNPLPAGHTFTVDFAEPADDATFFCVIDMNGRQVYRRKLAPGQTTYKLTGSRFGRGNYVYTVVYGDGHAVSGKLIAE